MENTVSEAKSGQKSDSSRMWSGHLGRVYRGIITKLGIDFPLHETKATCSQCLRSCQPDPQTGALFRADLKCCTFFPFVPNFLIGAVLCEGSERNIGIIRPWIEQDKAVTPLGIVPPLSYQQKFQAQSLEGFGRDENLLCPFFNRSTTDCGLWSFRPSACAAYHCESSYGERGMRFWRDAKDLLHHLDMALSQEALLVMGFTLPEISAALRYLPGSSEAWALSRESSKRIWMEFDNGREELFRKCFKYVIQLDAKGLMSHLKEEALADKFKLSYADIHSCQS